MVSATPAPRTPAPGRRGRRLVTAAVVVVTLAGTAVLSACSSSNGGTDVALSEAGTRGQQVVSDLGCTSCHTADGSRSTGPTWKDMAGAEVTLDGGTVVVADEEYLARAVLAPREEVVAGFPNIMPTYDGEITDEQLADVIAYFYDLSPATGGAGSGDEPAPTD